MSSSGTNLVQPIRNLRVAIGFLTRVPVGDVSNGDPSSVRMADAVPWFPVVGAGIGLVQGAIWRGSAEALSPLVAASLATAVALLVTGAFHHDGLADIADAFGGGWSVEQRFEILKDSRLGTYGTSALAMALVIEVATVASLEPQAGFRALVVAHTLGRVVALVVMVTAPVAGDGLGASYTKELSVLRVALGVAIGIAIAAILSPVLVVWPLLAVGLAATGVVVLAMRKIGGVTGDVLGAITVCATVASLIVTAATA